ncbi:transposase [Shewanella sp. SR44-3]|uniref:transposase n=1 Tax=Shewanella sp. SR44-3 TaxID=2760936 RepID=UPI0015FC89CC|nr:transposase [Shewanella sp. SR44-3]MBB1269701.1 transposase [Shewanella sp. SR44-3]
MNRLPDCPKRQQQMIKQVKLHKRLLSDVAKEYGVSSKFLYLLLQNSDRQQTFTPQTAILAKIAQLKQQINQLNQQLG